MKHSLLTMFISLSALGAGGALSATAQTDNFKYTNEQFADIQMLRYKVEGFEQLSLRQKTLIYHLSEAALAGRDILFDQNGRYNLRIREMLETVYRDYKGDRKSKDFQGLTLYLKRVPCSIPTRSKCVSIRKMAMTSCSPAQATTTVTTSPKQKPNNSMQSANLLVILVP